MPGPRIAVVYIGDANCRELTLYSLASIARSHKAPLDFRLMQSGYSAEIDRSFAEFVASRGHRLFAERVAFETPDFGSRASAKTYTYITDTMFLVGAAIKSLAEEYDYVLYMDSDTLAFGDLRLDALAGFSEPVAACVDQTIVGDRHDPECADRCRETAASSVLLNSGVIFVNAREWRRRGIYARFLQSLGEHQTACPYFKTCEPNDQCALNMALAGQWQPLDPALNVQKVAMHTAAWAQATVRHYTGRSKFLPLRVHRCDEREYALLCALSQEAGLPHPGSFYDGGLSYRLNGIRRLRDVKKAERAFGGLSVK